MQAQISTAFSRVVSAANALNSKALSLSTALATNVGSVASLSTAVSAVQSSGAQQRMLVRDEKSAGTPGGVAVSGLNDRVINTVAFNSITGASLSGNQVTLPAGTYAITAWSTGYRTDHARLSVCDSSNAELGHGASQYTTSSIYGTTVHPSCKCVITLTQAAAIKLRMHVTTAAAAGAACLGIALSSGLEVYSEMEILKL